METDLFGGSARYLGIPVMTVIGVACYWLGLLRLMYKGESVNEKPTSLLVRGAQVSCQTLSFYCSK